MPDTVESLVATRIDHSMLELTIVDNGPGIPPDILPLLMLPWDLLAIDKMEFWGKVNFLKGALAFSDYITTVSRKYSQELQTAEYGFGLDGVTLKTDQSGDKELYGKPVSNSEVVNGGEQTPAVAEQFLTALTQASSR